MPSFRKKRKADGRIYWLPTGEIRQSQAQPRRSFEREGIEELARSIDRYGILQPLTVRRRQGWYELVAGERRLRAAMLLGMTEVPCLITDVNMEEASVLALVENLQRRDLSFLEEAEGISRLIKLFGMSQEEAAQRLGKSPSAVANKLRLLRLPSDVLEKLGAHGLTERHGRALLRLESAQKQREALDRMIELGMNVAASERYVDAILSQQKCPGTAHDALCAPADQSTGAGRRTFVMKDIRMFYNTVRRGVDLMKQGGIEAEIERCETAESIILTISIPKGVRESSLSVSTQVTG